MSNNELLLAIYKMERGQGCLVLKCRDRKLCKVLGVLEPLRFAASMKQLSMAIDTGARQRCCYELQSADGLERRLYCSFTDELVVLELKLRGQSRFVWKGSSRELRVAVDGMLGKLPHW